MKQKLAGFMVALLTVIGRLLIAQKRPPVRRLDNARRPSL